MSYITAKEKVIFCIVLLLMIGALVFGFAYHDTAYGTVVTRVSYDGNPCVDVKLYNGKHINMIPNTIGLMEGDQVYVSIPLLGNPKIIGSARNGD